MRAFVHTYAKLKSKITPTDAQKKNTKAMMCFKLKPETV